MTSIADQYRIIIDRAGRIDRSSRGRVRFSGADARDFLQGLLTNDVSQLSATSGVYAAYLTPQGRMIADLTLVDRGDSILALVGDGLGQALATRFDLLIFAEAVTVTDASGEYAELEVTGPAAADVVAGATGVDAARLSALPALGVVECEGGFVLRDTASPFPLFRVVTVPEVRDRLAAALDAAGVVVMSDEMATALRIEAGRGLWGHDLGEDVIPLEAGLLDRAISTSKGCYVGQEIVIRILHRGGGRVARHLVTLEFDPGTEAPPAPSPLLVEGVATGQLTSVAFSPARERVIGLGYLRREAAEVGRVVTVGGSDARAIVTGFGQ